MQTAALEPPAKQSSGRGVRRLESSKSSMLCLASALARSNSLYQAEVQLCKLEVSRCICT